MGSALRLAWDRTNPGREVHSHQLACEKNEGAKRFRLALASPPPLVRRPRAPKIFSSSLLKFFIPLLLLTFNALSALSLSLFRRQKTRRQRSDESNFFLQFTCSETPLPTLASWKKIARSFSYLFFRKRSKKQRRGEGKEAEDTLQYRDNVRRRTRRKREHQRKKPRPQKKGDSIQRRDDGGWFFSFSQMPNPGPSGLSCPGSLTTDPNTSPKMPNATARFLNVDVETFAAAAAAAAPPPPPVGVAVVLVVVVVVVVVEVVVVEEESSTPVGDKTRSQTSRMTDSTSNFAPLNNAWRPCHTIS